MIKSFSKALRSFKDRVGCAATMKESLIDTYFFALVRVLDAIYCDEDNLDDVLFFITSLAAELTGGKGATIRVLQQGSFDLRVVASYGLSHEYLNSGAIDLGKSITEILRGDVIIINDLKSDPRIQNFEAADKEGLKAVIGIPFTVNDRTYSILRIYYPSRKVPTDDEMQFLSSLGKLSCIAIGRAVLDNLETGECDVVCK